ncbi:MAG: hypothetical protein GY774_21120 [Planctomycetes bacterium]|nr:hypothetical protein [Planctomycetota bacterium]
MGQKRNYIASVFALSTALLFSGCSGHTVIIKDEQSVKEFLRFEGVVFEDVWIPEKSDLVEIDEALEDYLKNKIKLFENDWQRTLYQGIKEEIEQYNKQYSGFNFERKRLLICNMYLYGTPPNDKEFVIILDGGCSVVRFIYDVENKRILSLRCNGPA